MSRVAEQVNDIHSRLNATSVSRVARPRGIDELQAEIRAAAGRRESLAVSGGRHAMGGQQFASGKLLLDLRDLNRVVGFDAAAGTIEMEAGADWPAVIRATHQLPPGPEGPWGIRQKQTGADRLTIGGAVFSDTSATARQENGIFVDGIGGNVLFQNAGALQVTAENNRADGVHLANGVNVALNNGLYGRDALNGNGDDGVEISAFSGTVTL